MNTTIIALTGPARVGKSTIANLFAEGPGRALAQGSPWRVLSFAAPIKAMASAILPREAFRDKEAPALLGVSARTILQTLGTDWGRNMIHRDVWVELMRQEICSSSQPVIIDDLRFANEAAMVLQLGGAIVEIERTGFTPISGITASHASERGIPRDLPDLVVRNGDPESAAWGIAYALRNL